jgi:hypothetical protein
MAFLQGDCGRAARGRRVSPRLLVRVDPERELADELVGDRRVGGVGAAEAGVAEQLLQPAAAEDPRTARDVHGDVDDLPRLGHGHVLRCDDLQWPLGAVVDAVGPVGSGPVDDRPGRLQRQAHLGHLVLHLGVVGGRPREPERRLLPGRAHDQVERPLRDAGVDVRETEECPGEDPDLELAGAPEARGADQRDVLVGDEGPLEHGVVALRRAHPQHVPGRLDPVPARGARDERVHDPRVLRVRRVHRVHPEPVPDRGEAAEDLVAGQLPAPAHPVGAGGGRHEAEVVAGLAVARGEDVAGGRALENPRAAGVAGAQQVRGQAGPVEVHVDRDRGGGSVVGEPALLGADLGQGQARTAVREGQGEIEVAGGAQLGEVLGEEAVLPVVDRGALVEPGEHLGGQGGGCRVTCHGGGHGSSWRRVERGGLTAPTLGTRAPRHMTDADPSCTSGRAPSGALPSQF